MCKHCKLTKGVPGEREAQRSIGSIKDGSLVFDVMLRRYIIDDDEYNVHEAELILDFSSIGCSDSLKTKHINIKYCPFCGEKL